MEFLESIDPTIAVILIGFVSGVIEMVKRAFDKDFRAAIIILAAGVAGGIGGYMLNIDLVIAIAAGFATSGYITIAQNIGKN